VEQNAKLHQNASAAEKIMEAVSMMGANNYGRDMLALKYKRIHDGAFAPRYATEGAACFDLMAVEDGSIPACDAKVFGLGLGFEIPPTHVLLVFSRSGHGFNHDVRLSNCVGVIDSDYRGEVMVKLTNDGGHAYDVRKGERIAQAMLVPIPRAVLVEVDELSETPRGNGGFGSTGHA
jgi:dUTP pyrophosphatase